MMDGTGIKGRWMLYDTAKWQMGYMTCQHL